MITLSTDRPWLPKSTAGYFRQLGRMPPKQECAHTRCPSCKGTGRDERGRACIHMISCPCPRCSPNTF